MSKTERKARTPNWTDDETQFLLELLDDYVRIIENKKTDSNAMKYKTDAWRKMEERFASNPCVSNRDVVQLQDRWKRMKMNAKKAYGDHQRDLKRTGGGECESDLPDWVDRVKSLVPEQFTRIDNPFDCDANPDTLAITDADHAQSLTIEEVKSPAPTLECSTEESGSDHESKSMVKTALAVGVRSVTITTTPTGRGETSSRKRAGGISGTAAEGSSGHPGQGKRPKLAMDKGDLLQTQLEFMEEEHDMRMQVLRQELRAYQAMEDHYRNLRGAPMTAPNPYQQVPGHHRGDVGNMGPMYPFQGGNSHSVGSGVAFGPDSGLQPQPQVYYEPLRPMSNPSA